jgi:hypothetical protein
MVYRLAARRSEQMTRRTRPVTKICQVRGSDARARGEPALARSNLWEVPKAFDILQPCEMGVKFRELARPFLIVLQEWLLEAGANQLKALFERGRFVCYGAKPKRT